MSGCGEWPACGHGQYPSECPDFSESGEQLNMKCVCGATVPLSSRSSICAGCLNPPPGHPDFDGADYYGDNQ